MTSIPKSELVFSGKYRLEAGSNSSRIEVLQGNDQRIFNLSVA